MEPAIPYTLEEAFDRLTLVLSAEEIENFHATPDDEVRSCYHCTLGAWMRSRWRLWHRHPALASWLLERGIHHADDMSDLVLVAYHRHLHGEDPDLEALVSEFRVRRETIEQ